MDQGENERRASGEQHLENPDITAEDYSRVGPCRCSQDVDWSICDENGNFYQRLRARLFNYLRRVAS